MADQIPREPREARLRVERESLERLNQKSDHVRVQAINGRPGREPVHYRVTFLCRGIAGIDSQNNPIYSDWHQVDINCDEEFPADVPRLRWMTPIWHPGIQHQEPKNVWINKAKWLDGMGLEDLCLDMFEMVEYKIYHAALTKAYPLNHEAARWVTEFAEPRGIVDNRRGIFTDNKLFIRPASFNLIDHASLSALPQTHRIRSQPVANPTAPARIKLVTAKPIVLETQIKGPRVRVVRKTDPE
jgi:ubiquitin-protein ligase